MKIPKAQIPETGESTHTPGKSFFREVQVEFLIHELKDPLSVIETGVRTLLEKQEKYGPLSPRQEKTLARTLRNSQKARSMIYDLLEVGRAEAACHDCCRFDPAAATRAALLEALETQSGSLAERMDGLADRGGTMAELEGLGIFMDVGPGVAMMQLTQDETKFRSVIGNLIKNAIKYRRKRMDISLSLKEAWLQVSVRDDGPGIDPKHHDSVFRRYTKIAADDGLVRSGHGLGLACSLILARSMGGDIDLESRRGRGAEFRLSLPVRSGFADISRP
jgi:two-component system, OmpR family, sensor kinase